MSHLKGLLETYFKRKHQGRHQDCTSLFHQYIQFIMHIRCHGNCCSRLKQGPYERDNYSLVTDKEKKVKAKPCERKAGVLKVNWKSYKSLYLRKRPLQHLAVNSGFNLSPTVPDRLSLKGSSQEPRHGADLQGWGPVGWWGCACTLLGCGRKACLQHSS